MFMYMLIFYVLLIPEKLSTDLTSLGESQERLAIVIEMVVGTDDGIVAASDIYRAIVVDHGKLAYNAVSAWLEGGAANLPQISSVPQLSEQLGIQIG